MSRITKFSAALVPALTLTVALAGPDVIVGDLPNSAHFGNIGTIHAYSVATTSCNIGDEELEWFANNNRHPVIAQNLYRLSNGRFEQIGMSFVKHGFGALQSNFCGGCIPANDFQHLGVGCSDPYTTGLNGSQVGMGPRSDINAATGSFPFPFTGSGFGGDTIFKRLQADEADLTVPGARYFFEGHYVTPDDAMAGNGTNNASWRETLFLPNFSAGMVGPTHREEPAVFAWADADPQVFMDSVDVPGDGRFWIASRAYDNGNGTFDYEYAVHNINSDRSGGGFSVPVGNAVVSNIGFHDVSYHSGEVYDLTDWPGLSSSGSVTWSTDAFGANPDANALRWGTLYNFRFTCDRAPQQGPVTLSLFKPGSPTSVTMQAWIPQNTSCVADFNNDGVLNFFDVQGFLDAFAAQDPRADLTGDSVFDFFDVAAFLDAFSAGCP